MTEIISEQLIIEEKKSNSNIELTTGSTSNLVNNNIYLPNTYGRPILTLEQIHSEHQKIIDSFLSYFWSLWYKKQESIWINSWIDDSVYFIWAPISVLKPYILNQNIPLEWVYMHQNCIRTRNIKTMFDDNITHNWGSCFSWIATLVNISDGEKLLLESIKFLVENLNIPLDNLKVQISSKDTDLQKMLENIESPIELIIDEKDDVYYTHKYWIWEIAWRNFNFVLREKGSNTFNDIWNFILIEDWKQQYWFELALWVSVIMKELFELDHVMETSTINKSLSLDILHNNKLKDCIVSSVLLYRNWLKPKASNTKWRILRSYLRGILYFCNKFNIDNNALLLVIKRYEEAEFWDNSWVKDFIIDYLNSTKKELQWKKHLSKEENYLLDSFNNQ